jgi:2'-5' RNA ligase
MPRRSVHDTKSRDTVRTFVCIEVPEAIKERIRRLQDLLREQNANVSWVKPSNIHLTLKFLGNVAQDRLASVCQAVESRARVLSPFEIGVSGAGCFPSIKNPRVFWVGLSEVPDSLGELQGSIDRALAQRGFEPESRKFAPHLTIGRVRSARNVVLVAEQLKSVGFEAASFSVTEVVVMRSKLDPSGSVYTPICKFGLGANSKQPMFTNQTRD